LFLDLAFVKPWSGAVILRNHILPTTRLHGAGAGFACPGAGDGPSPRTSLSERGVERARVHPNLNIGHTTVGAVRRLAGKAEVMVEGEDPRFVATHLPAKGFKGGKGQTRFTPARIYEELYCARRD
jgi:hypothetical protein